jgi:hypothetical protein
VQSLLRPVDNDRCHEKADPQPYNVRGRLHRQNALQSKIHNAITHAGTSPAAPRNQQVKGEREYPNLSSRLTAESVKTTPNRATTEERSAERGKGSYSGPPDDGSKPKKAINQAGNSAMSPTSQCWRGPQLEPHLLRYGMTAPVANNPRTPRIMENLVISSCSNLRALEVLAWETRSGCTSVQYMSGSP